MHWRGVPQSAAPQRAILPGLFASSVCWLGCVREHLNYSASDWRSSVARGDVRAIGRLVPPIQLCPEPSSAFGTTFPDPFSRIDGTGKVAVNLPKNLPMSVELPAEQAAAA